MRRLLPVISRSAIEWRDLLGKTRYIPDKCRDYRGEKAAQAARKGQNEQKVGQFMGKLFRFFFAILVLLVFAAVGFAYLGDLSPIQTDVSEPVELDVQ